MKKLFASVGLAALGASLQAQPTPGISSDQMNNQRGWSLATALRGFYDDNYLTEPNPSKRSSYGFEVTPLASFTHTENSGSVSLSYIYDYKYYLDHSVTDTSHQFNANVTEAFSERYSMKVGEAFIYSSEPTVLSGSGAFVNSPLRTTGDNVHNDGTISFNAILTDCLSLQLAYGNNLYAYQQTYGDVFNPLGGVPQPSRSALLDRIEQLATIDLTWKVMENLTGLLGYSYGHTEYTSPEPIIFNGAGAVFSTPGNIFSKSRNSDQHFVFVGAEYQFMQGLNGTIRAGGEYLDYYNEHANDTGPYIDAVLTWTYMQGSFLQGGVKHEHSATDVVGALGTPNGQPVLDAETTAAYLSINQQIAGNLSGSALGQYQHSAFNGGTVNGQSEDFFILNLNLAYKFNAYLNAEAGYNWNKLVSDVSERDYTRNMVYIGVRATY